MATGGKNRISCGLDSSGDGVSLLEEAQQCGRPHPQVVWPCGGLSVWDRGAVQPGTWPRGAGEGRDIGAALSRGGGHHEALEGLHLAPGHLGTCERGASASCGGSGAPQTAGAPLRSAGGLGVSPLGFTELQCPHPHFGGLRGRLRLAGILRVHPALSGEGTQAQMALSCPPFPVLASGEPPRVPDMDRGGGGGGTHGSPGFLLSSTEMILFLNIKINKSESSVIFFLCPREHLLEAI